MSVEKQEEEQEQQQQQQQQCWKTECTERFMRHMRRPVHEELLAMSGRVPVLQNVVVTFAFLRWLDRNLISMQPNCDFKPNTFAAAICRVKPQDTTALMFSTGNVVIVGAKSKVAARCAKQFYRRMLLGIGYRQLEMTPMELHNKVYSAVVGHGIDVVAIRRDQQLGTRFEPDIFPGLILAHPVRQQRVVVVLVFDTGKVIMMGIREDDEEMDVWRDIYPILQRYKDTSSAQLDSHGRYNKRVQSFVKMEMQRRKLKYTKIAVLPERRQVMDQVTMNAVENMIRSEIRRIVAQMYRNYESLRKQNAAAIKRFRKRKSTTPQEQQTLDERCDLELLYRLTTERLDEWKSLSTRKRQLQDAGWNAMVSVVRKQMRTERALHRKQQQQHATSDTLPSNDYDDDVSNNDNNNNYQEGEVVLDSGSVLSEQRQQQQQQLEAIASAVQELKKDAQQEPPSVAQLKRLLQDEMQHLREEHQRLLEAQDPMDVKRVIEFLRSKDMADGRFITDVNNSEALHQVLFEYILHVGDDSVLRDSRQVPGHPAPYHLLPTLEMQQEAQRLAEEALATLASSSSSNTSTATDTSFLPEAAPSAPSAPSEASRQDSLVLGKRSRPSQDTTTSTSDNNNKKKKQQQQQQQESVPSKRLRVVQEPMTSSRTLYKQVNQHYRDMGSVVYHDNTSEQKHQQQQHQEEDEDQVMKEAPVMERWRRKKEGVGVGVSHMIHTTFSLEKR